MVSNFNTNLNIRVVKYDTFNYCIFKAQQSQTMLFYQIFLKQCYFDKNLNF